MRQYVLILLICMFASCTKTTTMAPMAATDEDVTEGSSASETILKTWVSGANIVNQSGVYGIEGSPASDNIPGGRYGAVSWSDVNNHFWLFGGYGKDAQGNNGYLNDLWEFDETYWTWVNGAKTINQVGNYGVKGVADVNNIPGARTGAVSWKNSDGQFLLFGGWSGSANQINRGYLNDLWKFDGTYWTWIGGASIDEQAGVYGTKGIVNVNNIPGGRSEAISWMDSDNNVWLFGGRGHDSNGDLGYLNDLWKFDGTSWVWISGANTINQTGTYGTKGISSASSVPGARVDSISWTDHDGIFWLFGGWSGSFNEGRLNDLWKFDGTLWTWVSGSNEDEQAGVYGTMGIAGTNCVPGARLWSLSWVDADNNLWLVGGQGMDSAGNWGYLNDMWKFDGDNWTWMEGDQTRSAIGVYGTKGVSDLNNIPGGRDDAILWRDSNSNDVFWIFGGYGADSAEGYGLLNDLWKIEVTQ